MRIILTWIRQMRDDKDKGVEIVQCFIRFLQMMTMNNIRDILKEAQVLDSVKKLPGRCDHHQVGEVAPNPELIDLETRTKLPLVSLAK